jgi:hypothetical protein
MYPKTIMPKHDLAHVKNMTLVIFNRPFEEG